MDIRNGEDHQVKVRVTPDTVSVTLFSPSFIALMRQLDTFKGLNHGDKGLDARQGRGAGHRVVADESEARRLPWILLLRRHEGAFS